MKAILVSIFISTIRILSNIFIQLFKKICWTIYILKTVFSCIRIRNIVSWQPKEEIIFCLFFVNVMIETWIIISIFCLTV